MSITEYYALNIIKSDNDKPRIDIYGALFANEDNLISLEYADFAVNVFVDSDGDQVISWRLRDTLLSSSTIHIFTDRQSKNIDSPDFIYSYLTMIAVDLYGRCFSASRSVKSYMLTAADQTAYEKCSQVNVRMRDIVSDTKVNSSFIINYLNEGNFELGVHHSSQFDFSGGLRSGQAFQMPLTIISEYDLKNYQSHQLQKYGGPSLWHLTTIIKPDEVVKKTKSITYSQKPGYKQLVYSRDRKDYVPSPLSSSDLTDELISKPCSVLGPDKLVEVAKKLERRKESIKSKYSYLERELHQAASKKLNVRGCDARYLEEGGETVSVKIAVIVASVIFAVPGIWLITTGFILLTFLGIIWICFLTLIALTSLLSPTLSLSTVLVLQPIKSEFDHEKAKLKKACQDQLDEIDQHTKNRCSFFMQLPIQAITKSYVSSLDEEDQYYLYQIIEHRLEEERNVQNIKKVAVAAVGVAVVAAMFGISLPPN